MPSLADSHLSDLEHEFESTRRMLERVPEAHLEFKPHEKSWPLRKMAKHVATLPSLGILALTTDGIALDGPMPTFEIRTAADYVKVWDELSGKFREALAQSTDDQLQQVWTATFGGHPVLQMPRIAMLRNTVLNHLIHHRAQLSMYYRLVDVPLPPLYGPSADER
jgi:uncharacterized damage-inducible protein DinB